jgi:hypothetical protein
MVVDVRQSSPNEALDIKGMADADTHVSDTGIDQAEDSVEGSVAGEVAGEFESEAGVEGANSVTRTGNNDGEV